jgi:hypothetical protein
MVILTERGKRYVSLGDVTAVMPMRREGDWCYVTVIPTLAKRSPARHLPMIFST